MNARDAIEQYILWRRSLGAKLVTQSAVLRHFLKCVDGGVGCDDVTPEQVRAFIAGAGPLTRTRAGKYSALAAFYRYAISRGYATRWPLPDNEPKRPRVAPPYVYSREEVRRLLDGVERNARHALQVDADTMRTLILLLYGAGLRGGEARRLTLADVDLKESVLTVRRSKFFKTRLVPVGPQLAGVLAAYARRRVRRPLPEGRNSTFLANRDGTPLVEVTVLTSFARLRRRVGIHGAEGCLRPGMHSFRHSFAVHRVTAWYREGADVQRLLPALSTYLGHAHLSSTQVYLTMTPELLQEASLRLERHARGGSHA